MTRFAGKNVLITGGTSGIGLATAQRVHAEGGRLVLTGSRQESVDAAGHVLPDASCLVNDAGDPSATAALAEAARTAGGLDGVMLNAGFGRFSAFDAATPEEFDAHFDVLVKGPLLQAKALSPVIKDGGSIVITSSVVSAMGMPGSAIYASSKGAVRSLVRVLARELAERGVRVNAISPGPISTGFAARTGMTAEEMDAFGKQIEAMVPLGRFGAPEEVAAVAAFLLSSDASYVTGADYIVDGGMSEL